MVPAWDGDLADFLGTVAEWAIESGEYDAGDVVTVEIDGVAHEVKPEGEAS